MGLRLPSYKPDGRCHCWFSQPGEPCWGRVEITDEFCNEDYTECEVVYTCEAHEGITSFSTPWKWTPSPHPEDAGKEPVEDDA